MEREKKSVSTLYNKHQKPKELFKSSNIGEGKKTTTFLEEKKDRILEKT